MINKFTAQQLRDRLHYNPATGVFTWLVRACNNFGSIENSIGRMAGRDNGRYIQITLGGRTYNAHRLAWLYMTGDWPPACVDHINRDTHDNRWANLRAATVPQNMQNAKTRIDSRSGHRGVSYERGRWRARIQAFGKRQFLGYFAAKEDARSAYREAAARLHGEFGQDGRTVIEGVKT